MPAIRIDKCPHCAGVLRERTTEQNAKLHALLTDISQQREWAGKHIDVEAWKRLMVAAWERANKHPAEFYPAIDGQGFDVVYRRTSRLAKQDMIDLIEYVTAWAVDNGIVLAEAA
jgi:hypothetical protein